jgi:hypothetical protein
VVKIQNSEVILMLEYIPNDKYPRGQVVHQQRYMFGG